VAHAAGGLVKPRVRDLIHRTSVLSGGLGVLLSPIPLLDELALFPVYTVLSTRIARSHELEWREMPWRPILKSTAVGLVARAAVNVAFVAVPGVAAVTSAATAAALTEILGRYVDGVCVTPEAAQTLTVREVIDMLKKAVALKSPKTA
jgi:uncharacterized protein (DUF697 family)